MIMRPKCLLLGFLSLLLAGHVATAQTKPPERLHYQGVLRDSMDAPLEGAYAMTFRFFDAESGGEEILVDVHDEVVASNGLFSVDIGSGEVQDGQGPGVFSSLSMVFASYEDVFLEVEVAGERLAPRTPVAASAYALNTRRVRGFEIVSGGDLEIWVDGLDGNDANDGMTEMSAKKTITGALRAIPLVLDGNVSVRIDPGTYREELTLSGRHRTGPFWILLTQNTPDPESDQPGVIIKPPQPCEDCQQRGITVLDELVRIVGLRVEDFKFFDGEDWDGQGIVASGSTNLTFVNVVVANNQEGIFATDGHFVECEARCVLDGNTVGLLAGDHGSLEINAPFESRNNGNAAIAELNSWIRFEGDSSSCQFEPGDGGMIAEYHSSITLDGSCSGWSCTEGLEGLCVPATP